MKILADLRMVSKLLTDAQAIAAGPVAIEIFAPVHVKITAIDGTVILDTVVEVDRPEPPKVPATDV